MEKRDDIVEINLAKLLQFYLQNILKIMAGVLLCIVLALLSTRFLMTPIYRADVTIYVNNTRSGQTVEFVNGSNLATAQQLVNTYVNIINSNTVLDNVIQTGDLNCTVKELRDMMSAEQIDDTEMFTVSISDPDPKMAAHIVNTIARIAPEKISEFVEGSSTKVIDYAQVPASPYTPSYAKNLVLGGLLGCLVMLTILTFRYMFDMRIKSEDDIEQYFHAPVLGIIPSFDQNHNKHRSGYDEYGYAAGGKGEQ